MNQTILAARTAKAVERLEAEIGRLGGRLQVTPVRTPNPATRYVLVLEAIAEALAQIEIAPPPESPPPPAKPATRGRGREKD